ncbi:MAG TPA: preprotein translocase subunit SecG [Candidatus Omnitrophota bacterium]|nr:preprotein translocase subunit SecG [Candidatus Omnitrophota bacterium]HPS37489.1 preprotein translocase subunit SecG [Candidatus Omnitrophota bacterium]
MNALVVSIHIIVCLVLIVVILLQAGRGQGLTGASFGGNVQSLFGTKASSFLTKATSICAVLFLFTCIGLNVLEVRKSRSLFQAPKDQAPLDVNQIKKALEKIKQSQKTAPATADAAKTAAASAQTGTTDAVKAAAAAAQATASAVKTDVAAAAKAEAPKQ